MARNGLARGLSCRSPPPNPARRPALSASPHRSSRLRRRQRFRPRNPCRSPTSPRPARRRQRRKAARRPWPCRRHHPQAPRWRRRKASPTATCRCRSCPRLRPPSRRFQWRVQRPRQPAQRDQKRAWLHAALTGTRAQGNNPRNCFAANTFSTPIAIAAMRLPTRSRAARALTCWKARSRSCVRRWFTSFSSQNSCCRS